MATTDVKDMSEDIGKDSSSSDELSGSENEVGLSGYALDTILMLRVTLQRCKLFAKKHTPVLL